MKVFDVLIKFELQRGYYERKYLILAKTRTEAVKQSRRRFSSEMKYKGYKQKDLTTKETEVTVAIEFDQYGFVVPEESKK